MQRGRSIITVFISIIIVSLPILILHLLMGGIILLMAGIVLAFGHRDVDYYFRNKHNRKYLKELAYYHRNQSTGKTVAIVIISILGGLMFFSLLWILLLGSIWNPFIYNSSNDILDEIYEDTTIYTSSVTISLSQFNQLEIGMDYSEVTNILNGECELTSHTGSGFMDIKMYGCNGNGFGANAILTFTDNELESKTQFGLK